MSVEKKWIHAVNRFLPVGARLLGLSRSSAEPLVVVDDLNHDGHIEVIAVYEWQGEANVLVLQKIAGIWRMFSTIPARGYGVSYFKVTRVKSRNAKDVVIGWQVGAAWSELSILHFSKNRVVDLAVPGTHFSLLEVKDMPGERGLDGLAELALWRHDTGEAYQVDVYRYSGGTLVKAYDVYPYYFSKVTTYYRRLVERHPDTSIYLHYLTEAKLKQKRTGNEITPLPLEGTRYPAYSSSSQEQWAYPVKMKTLEGDKWGYINDQGRFLLQPIYDYAEDFANNGLAVVTVNNRSGVIDQSGRYIVSPLYHSITDFHEGRAAAQDDAGFHLIDETGQVLTKKPYRFIGRFQEGRALVGDTIQEKYKYGYIDRLGRLVIPLQYESAADFKEGKALAQLGEKQFVLIGLNGERLHSYSYPFVGSLGEGLLVFQPAVNSKYGYMNEQGDIVIPPQFTGALAFSDGIAVVNMGDGTNQYGLINKKGNFVIAAQYNDLNDLREGMVSAGKAIKEEQPYLGSIYAIANAQGYFLTDFILTTVQEYKRGRASASDGQRKFFIDKQGQVVRTLPIVEGDGTLTFERNLIRANVDQRTFYLDQAGNIVWKSPTTIRLNEQYRVREEKYKPNKNFLVYYPQVEGMRNQSIQQKVNQKLKEQSKVGSVDPSAQLDSAYTGDFSVTFFRKHLLVFELNGYDYHFGAAHGMPFKMNPHIDLQTGQFYTLDDLFKPGSNYVLVLSDIVGKQIKQHSEIYFPDSYKGISSNQPFYVLESTLNLYFAPYEIAPYAAGFPTFTIPFTEIISIIHLDGSFWRSFH